MKVWTAQVACGAPWRLATSENGPCPPYAGRSPFRERLFPSRGRGCRFSCVQKPSRPERSSTSSRRSRSSFRASANRSLRSFLHNASAVVWDSLNCIRAVAYALLGYVAVQRAQPVQVVVFQPDQLVVHGDRLATFIRVNRGEAIIRYRGDSHAHSVPLESLSLPPPKRR
jgi:hypothetical protein